MSALYSAQFERQGFLVSTAGHIPTNGRILDNRTLLSGIESYCVRENKTLTNVNLAAVFLEQQAAYLSLQTEGRDEKTDEVQMKKFNSPKVRFMDSEGTDSAVVVNEIWRKDGISLLQSWKRMGFDQILLKNAPFTVRLGFNSSCCLIRICARRRDRWSRVFMLVCL